MFCWLCTVASLESHSNSLEVQGMTPRGSKGADGIDICSTSSNTDKLTPNSTNISDSEIIQTRPGEATGKFTIMKFPNSKFTINNLLLVN